MADEHLDVHLEDSRLDMYRKRLRNYGSLFLGTFTFRLERSGQVSPA